MTLNFRKSDFEQIEYSYIFVNQTSGTECREFARIKIQKFTPDGVILRVPNTSCAKGHNLLLMIYKGSKPKLPKFLPKEGRGKGIYFSAVTKVMHKESWEEDNTMAIVEVRFTQYDKHGWDEILQEYKDKQCEVNNVIDKMKVHE